MPNLFRHPTYKAIAFNPADEMLKQVQHDTVHNNYKFPFLISSTA